MGEAKEIVLTVRQCTQHGYTCIDVGEKDGSSLRITSAKCCGSWNKVIKSYRMSEYDLTRAADEFRKLARKIRAQKAA